MGRKVIIADDDLIDGAFGRHWASIGDLARLDRVGLVSDLLLEREIATVLYGNHLDICCCRLGVEIGSDAIGLGGGDVKQVVSILGFRRIGIGQSDPSPTIDRHTASDLRSIASHRSIVGPVEREDFQSASGVAVHCWVSYWGVIGPIGSN
jgi:hypothetical protein